MHPQVVDAADSGTRAFSDEDRLRQRKERDFDAVHGARKAARNIREEQRIMRGKFAPFVAARSPQACTRLTLPSHCLLLLKHNQSLNQQSVATFALCTSTRIFRSFHEARVADRSGCALKIIMMSVKRQGAVRVA